MSPSRSVGSILSLSTLILSAGACSMFGGDTAVRMDRGGADTSLRWNATLNSPSSLRGAVDIEGTAWMFPSDGGEETSVMVELRNAAPGGAHPWEMRRGRCGEPGTMLGSSNNYRVLQVGNDGTALSESTLYIRPNPDASYHVRVLASAANRDLIIACGNLAPPSN